MKKLTLFLAGVFCFFYLNGQKIGVFGGNNILGFYPGVLNEEETWSHEVGIDFGVFIEDITKDNFRIALRLDNYKGCYQESFRAQGGGSNTHLNINKTVLTFQVFPLNITLLSNLRINFGGECNCLLYDATTGVSHSWQVGTSRDNPSTSSSQNFVRETWDGNKRISAGIINRLAYEIALPDEWFLVPQFSFYVGLTDEFKSSTPDKTMRAYLEIGLSKKLKQKTR